jgi:hypothetical protein
MKKVNQIFLVIFSVFILPCCWGYEHFIGFGYTNCLTCHYNPYGNGPLNSYGKAISATLVSARDVYPDTWTEEDLVKVSGFLLNSPKTKNLDASIGYRHLYASQNTGSDSEKNKDILMMAEVTGVIKSDSTDKFILLGDIGYDVGPSLRGESGFHTISREYYAGYRTEKVGVYIGLMDLVFGLRVAEHTFYSRIFNDIYTDDQKHGVLFHFNFRPIEWGLQFYLGKLDDESVSNSTKKGFSSRLDYEFNSRFEIGISNLYNKSDNMETFSNALHLKKGFGKGSSILFEGGYIQKKKSNSSDQKIIYTLMQNFLLIRRGFFLSTSVEYLNLSLEDGSSMMRVGPGIQYFPMQRLELKLDVLNTRSISESFYSEDRWDILLNLHIYL